jgi:hypothetical protein
MYVRGYLQGSENGRVVTIVCIEAAMFVVLPFSSVFFINLIKIKSQNLPPIFILLFTYRAFEI